MSKLIHCDWKINGNFHVLFPTTCREKRRGCGAILRAKMKNITRNRCAFSSILTLSMRPGHSEDETRTL